MVAIDTNVAIAHLRDKLVLPVSISVEQFALPAVVAGELLFGARNSGRPVENLAYYRDFIYGLEVLEADILAAEYYAEIRLALKQLGRPIPENDMWIAAICQSHQVPLFTLDHHFEQIAGLYLVEK